MSDRQLDHNSGSDNLHLTSGESDSSQPEKHNSFLAEFSQSRPSDIKKVQAGPDTGADAETIERFKEFLKSFGVNPEAEANERPAEPKDLAPNPGRQAFDKTYNDLEAENIKSFRTKQPDFRKGIEMADKHLVDAANNYVLEGYTSERFDKITTLGENMSENVDGIYDSLKKIPLHQDQVKVVELVNRYLNGETPDTDKPEILAELKKSGVVGTSIADRVEKLDKDQKELKPLYEKEQEERARVYMAYKDAAEVRGAYSTMLETAIQSPLTDDSADTNDQKELEDLELSGSDLVGRFGQFSRQPMISNKPFLQLEPPKPPKTFSA